MDVEVAQPVAAPQAPTAPVETETLADHEAQFGPGAKRDPQPAPTNGATTDAATEDADTERDAGGRFKQRAKSHQATPSDVEEIGQLTKRLRQAEADAGITKPDRNPGESDRAYSMRRQLALVEALRDAKRATAAPSTPAPRTEPVAARPVSVQAAPFTTPRPKPEDFATADEPAEAYYEAIADWKFDKRIHEAQQALLAQRASESQAQIQQQHAERKAIVDGKIDAFVKAGHADWDEKLKSVEDIPISDLLAHTIWTDDNAPELMYYYATHPAELAELSLMTGGFTVDDQSAALLRRRLHAQAIGAKTGAPPPVPAPVTVAPHPPTPVRTGPLKTGDEPPDDNDMSLANHEKHFGYKRR